MLRLHSVFIMAEKGSTNCTHVIFDLDGLMLGKNSNSFVQTGLKFYGILERN